MSTNIANQDLKKEILVETLISFLNWESRESTFTLPFHYTLNRLGCGNSLIERLEPGSTFVRLLVERASLTELAEHTLYYIRRWEDN